MINKEKLLNGYIKNEEGELMDLARDAVKCYFPDVPIFESNKNDWPFYCLDMTACGCDYGYIERNNRKELTIDDFKPKTKVTYELVTDMTINEIAKAMIDGEVFYNKDGKVSFRWDGSMFVNNIDLPIQFHGLFYRKVEKELSWEDAVIDWHKNLDAVHRNDDRIDSNIALALQDVTWENISYNNLIDLCHAVAELTDKPE